MAAVKLFEQEDKKIAKRGRRTAKLLRRMKHKRERHAAKGDPDHLPTYKRYCGWER